MMLDDSSVRVLLSRGGVAFAAEAGGLSVVLLDEAAEALARESADAPRSGATAENLAYIVYTSGSTGRPKGVMVAHRHVVQLVVETDYVRFQPGDRVAQASNASFDALTFEAWGALMNGATLVGIPRDVLLSPAAFRETLREQGITTLYQTTALLNQLSREQPDIFAPLREVLFGGQAVDADSVRRLLKGGKPRRLLHMYGPTETTAWCSYEQVEHVAEAAPTVAVGGPTGNQRIYLLDPALEPVPTGVPGEAYVGGGGVVRGYLDRPGLTAERFLPDPFATEPGTRMYRTGDRLRWKADGKLEFIGRVDEQVKIRGFRIEPGEVESAVAAHPGVREARVIVREDTPGEKRLVAYLVGGVEVEEVRAYLRQNLPEYMVPGGFVVLESLPLTRNGKLDVRALPAPEYGAGEDRYVAPRTATEDVLAGIWAEVLGLERVGVEEGFFDLGGHSLLATRVVARARQAFGMEVPLRALFEAPTVAALAARIEALRTGGGEVATPIVRIPREGVLPLSFAQQRLWFLHQIDPRSVAYNVPLALRFRGELDTLALERSFGEVVRRHEVLRTVFRVTAEGEVEQVVEPAAPARLARIDLAGLPNPQRERELRSIVREEAALPFDLKRGPLFRTTLIRAADDEHVLLLTMHHVVTDGWSTGVLTREFSALYPAFREGRPSPLPELPIQYADYAVWQQEWLRGETLERHLAYWTERLSGAPELLEIPTDHPRPATMSFRGAFEPMHLPSGVVERLEALARGEGATLYMVVLGAFQVLLGKYAGSEDVVVGSTIAGRTHREVEPLIGLFMNTLVLRVDLAGDPGFREVLRRVREAALGAYEHQAMPFEKLVQELRPERSLSHTPVFQVLFELHTSENGGAGLPGLRVGVLDTDAATSKFDLSLTLTATSRGLSGGLVYSTDLFERGTARRIVKHLERVLRQVVGDPDRRLSGLELMGRADRAKLAEWNRTAASYPAERCIHQLFEAQAENTPDAVAVTFEERALTYRELDRRANRLAHHLAGLGVGPEVRVGLCLERSLEVMVAILGVLKAGGAYVPLDASHPAERLAYVLEDSGVAVLLTQDKVRERLPVPEGVTVVTLDPEWEPAGAGSAGPPESGVTSENLCYVIYTSGSTGRPKGVAMHHRGVCNYIDWGTRAYGADQGTGAPVFTSMAVDLTITNLLPLFAGRSVRLLPEENAVEVLAQVLRERPNFGLIKITPVHLGLLNTMLAPEHTREAAHTLVIGADFLSAEPTLFWQEHAPGVRLMNEYGPTETVVGCSAYVVPPGRHRAGAVPVGPPIQNLAFHVLDAQMGPVPVGLPGELYIGGAGVARGYLGRPGLSAEKFLPDPFAEAGARMYRTGDRARWLQDGNLLILGRTDNQVKIRGFRVELGEIEAALRRREELRECLVVVREDRPGDRRLVAYVVADPETTDPAVLRDHLRQSLPEYMVPGAFVVLESLPHTPTGKLDPRMLPAPSYLLADMQVEEPANYVEAQLIQVWESLLGIDGIGPTQSFFDLGGNSFLALRLFTQVNQRFDCDLPVATLFAGATVRHMAAAILEQKSSAPTPRASVVPLQPHGSLPPLFLVHSADRNVVGYVNLVRHLGADQPVYGVRDVGEDLSRPVVRIAAEHVAAIREVQPRGPYYLASWSFGGIVAFEMALQLEREGETVAFVGLLDTIVPTVVMEERVKRGADLVIALAEDDAARARLPFALRREDLEGLDLDAQIRRAAEALHPGEPALQELEAAVLREAYHTGQDRIRSRSGYVPGHFSGTLTLFRVSELTEGYQEFLASSTGEERHTLGWAPYTENPVEVHLMPGQHATLASEPHVRVLAQSMREALDSARLRAGHEGAGETRPEPSPHLLQRA
jgi:amino acid adenylation domain-containing protein